MPIAQHFETNESAAQDAKERQTALALSKLRLFKSTFLPTAVSVKQDFVDNECDFDTYVEKTLTAWFNPILAPGSGYLIESPLVQFGPLVDPVVVGNVVGGYWVEDAAGIVRDVVVFANYANMQTAGQGIPLNDVIVFPAG